MSERTNAREEAAANFANGTAMSKFSKQNLSGAKLTGEMVLWGREQYAAGLLNMRQLAAIQMVSRETVARYIRGETWKELGLGAGEHQEAREEAIRRMAEATAPAHDSPQIQASLARLAKLMNSDGLKEDQDNGEDPKQTD